MVTDADRRHGDDRAISPTAAMGRADRPDASRWLPWAAALGAVLIVLTGLRIVALRFNATDLFFDEAQYWSWSLVPAFGYYSKPPLIAWVIRLATDSCGLSEFCIRLPAPLMHAATASAIFVAATRLYDARVGFWSAVVFATLPGVSLSAGLISTDVPLLLFWAIALASLVALYDRPMPTTHPPLSSSALGRGSISQRVPAMRWFRSGTASRISTDTSPAVGPRPKAEDDSRGEARTGATDASLAVGPRPKAEDDSRGEAPRARVRGGEGRTPADVVWAWCPAVTLGLALGLGLNAKYAMAYFVVCLAFAVVLIPERRLILRDPRLWVALAIGVVLIVPNLVWNASNAFSTFAHTADNAKWAGRLGNPGKAVEFFGAQFGVFGPILFAGLLIVAWRAWARGVGAADRLLLAFSLPVLAIVTAQAFLSRAHANWAAVTYVAATILVVATLVRELSWRWLTASLGLHVAAALVIAVGTATAGRIAIPGIADPFARTLGWADVAKATRGTLADLKAAGTPVAAVITDDRAMSAELLYYMRDEPTPLYAWRAGKPQNHFELTRPYVKGAPEPVLLVSFRRDAADITRYFTEVMTVARVSVPAGRGPARDLVFYRLGGFKGLN